MAAADGATARQGSWVRRGRQAAGSAGPARTAPSMTSTGASRDAGPPPMPVRAPTCGRPLPAAFGACVRGGRFPVWCAGGSDGRPAPGGYAWAGNRRRPSRPARTAGTMGYPTSWRSTPPARPRRPPLAAALRAIPGRAKLGLRRLDRTLGPQGNVLPAGRAVCRRRDRAHDRATARALLADGPCGIRSRAGESVEGQHDEPALAYQRALPASESIKIVLAHPDLHPNTANKVLGALPRARRAKRPHAQGTMTARGLCARVVLPVPRGMANSSTGTVQCGAWKTEPYRKRER